MWLLLHPFNSLFSRTPWVSRHQKGKPDFTGARDDGVAVASTANHFQTDNDASTLSLHFYRLDALPATPFG